MAALIRSALCLSSRYRFHQLVFNSKLSETQLFESIHLHVTANPHLYEARRYSSIFTTHTAEEIWKGVTTVSNAGRKRGRGKGTGRKQKKDLNKGQFIGVGDINVIWPGLNSPIIKGKELIKQTELPPDPERHEKLIRLRNEMSGFRPVKLGPLERGWSGGKIHGRSAGPPDPIGDETFEGFDSRILEVKPFGEMTGNFGRVRKVRILVVTGNGNGVAGYSSVTSNESKTGIRRARNRAVNHLIYVERFENHTVCHDFVTEYNFTRIFVKKKPKGFGLVCHRAIREICRLVGITDIHAKIEGSTNVHCITKAFFLGLYKQKTMDQLAEEMGLHLVEFRKERDFYPKVIASPTKCRTASQIAANEITDYQEIINEGRVEIFRPPFEPFYTKLPSYQIYLRKTRLFRNAVQTRVNLTAQYGELKSFLTLREEERQKAKEAADLKEGIATNE